MRPAVPDGNFPLDGDIVVVVIDWNPDGKCPLAKGEVPKESGNAGGV